MNDYDPMHSDPTRRPRQLSDMSWFVYIFLVPLVVIFAVAMFLDGIGFFVE